MDDVIHVMFVHCRMKRKPHQARRDILGHRKSAAGSPIAQACRRVVQRHVMADAIDAAGMKATQKFRAHFGRRYQNIKDMAVVPMLDRRMGAT